MNAPLPTRTTALSSNGTELTGAEILWEVLVREGVEVVFGYPGGAIMPAYDAMARYPIHHVLTRHEQGASHMADGYARALRKPGVAVITAGPGVTNGFTGIVNAQLAGSPVLCIGGQSQFEFRDMGALQEMSHLPFIEPVTTWARSIVDPARIPDTVAKAMRRCSTGSRGVSFIEAPMDLLMAPAQRPTDVAHGIVQPVNHPAPTDLDQILWLLERAERPMVLAGSKVYWDEAWEPLARFAEAAAVPVYTNGMGRGTLPPSHPYFFQHSRSAAMKEAEMQYPIIVDNDKKNWSTWGNTMWPTVYLIDKQGYVRTWWMGELNWKGAGMQKVMKQHIRTLLAK